MLFCAIFAVIGVTSDHYLTCKDVLETPEKKLTLEELSSMLPKDIVNCLPHLARESMSEIIARFIWETLIQYYEGMPNVPENILSQLNWVTAAITPEEYANISISSIDIVTNFGLNYDLDQSQLEAIADRVREDFAGKIPEDYTYYDLKALNQILCAFNKSEVERIHPAAYKESASFIGTLKNCSSEVMMGFANLAVHEDAFGPVHEWSLKTLKTVGGVAQYLPGILDADKERLKNVENGAEY